jgi:dienelactone hydrolase
MSASAGWSLVRLCGPVWVPLTLLAVAAPCLAEPQPLPVPSECLVLRMAPQARRPAAGADPIYYQLMRGALARPAAGDVFTYPDGSTGTWERVSAGDGGAFDVMGAYTYLPVESDRDRVALLEVAGDGAVVVNSETHAGDVYSYGWLRFPVRLRQGTNDILLLGSRGRLQVRLFEPDSPVGLDTRDATLPDLVTGEPADMLAAVVVVNATDQTTRGLRLVSRVGDAEPLTTDLPALPPLSTRKVPFRVVAGALSGTETVPVTVRVLGATDEPLASGEVSLRVRGPKQTRKVTFESAIDGSVQYYAINPASGDAQGGKALVLTCHGAAVEAIGQADAYAPKTWADLVAPTNRRPYGFDWEDWGRLDALEVLEDARARLAPDPSRIYLTGHSMGGHGAWHLGVTYPDKFACTGPSAGWISMWTRGRRDTETAMHPVEELLRRASRPSDTQGLAPNLVNNGVYVLHGDADDNVPVDEARLMRDLLAPWHRDFVYHEEPGQGHWWSNTDEPGSACVDWAPMFQFFSRHRIPSLAEVRDVDFTTMSPTVSDTCYWARIEGQQKQFDPSAVKLRWDPIVGRVTGTTANVSRLRIALPGLAPKAVVKVVLDGAELSVETDPLYDGAFWLARGNAGWEMTAPLPPTAKRPERGGPFRAAFSNRMVFVYGTGGTPEENAWALARARYDAESFYYRGNGSVDTVADADFDPEAYRDRNVILFGNRDTNSAWATVLDEDEPVVIEEGRFRFEGREVVGDGMGCLLVRPRVDSLEAQVGVVGGTGMAGMHATDRLNYLQPGVGYPDFLLVSESILERGPQGILASGYFGENWDTATGEFAWR